MSTFKDALGLQADETPFPWQDDLLSRFIDGIGSRMSLDIPTGLGKTSVMAAWLVARSQGAALPRRLVYIVDRRAVVDQATREAEGLREWVDSEPNIKSQLGLASDRQLAISTLRGQFVDNREWLEDPSSPAIIVGTVDMIGSRLLFEGYGVSRKMRPFHAGMLGADTLFVLDEAHLVPPFELMLETLVLSRQDFGADAEVDNLVPAFKLLSLSATGRNPNGDVLRLTDKDLKHPIAKKRLEASKRLSFCESDETKPLSEWLADEARNLAENGKSNVRIIVFSNSRDDAEKARDALVKKAKGDKKQGIEKVKIEAELFVGARRVWEREAAANWLGTYGFLAGSNNRPEQPTFLFATRAGEVGVDLDADHMVCDLVEWERMVQRLGRVNRRGNGDASIHVVVEFPQPDKKTQQAMDKAEGDRTKAEQKKAEQYVEELERIEKLRRPLLSLPKQDGHYNASPGAIRQLNIRAENDDHLAELIRAATSPAPLRPALTRPVVDAWSMTSLEKHTGRPLVAPWLRGWVEDRPQTTLLWRRFLPVCERTNATPNKQMADAKEFFEQAPPHLSEILERESYRVLDWLMKRAKAIQKAQENQKSVPSKAENDGRPILTPDSIVGIILGSALDVVRFLSLNDLIFDGNDKTENKRRKDRLEIALYSNTLILDSRFGGLHENGLLDFKADDPPELTGDDERWNLTGFRVRYWDGESEPSDPEWRTCYRFVSRVSTEGEPESWLLVQKSKQKTSSEESRSIAPKQQTLAAHQKWAESEADRLASELKLPPDYAKMLRVAARLHDEGKQVERWQNAFSALPNGRPYAKTQGPLKLNVLGGYRHEFGSLRYVECDPEFQTLSPDLRELALHLVAAHHGFARPAIRPDGCEDGPPSLLESRVRDVALRFAKLQRRWGPWGLAWWESLLRAADQRASRKLESPDTESNHG